MGAPTFSHNYIGEFANDVAAVAQLAVQGITLTTGMWYFNTTLKTLREYDGTVWYSAMRSDGVVDMTGDLDMGTNDITNVGLVDGADVSAVAALAHAQQHAITSGANHTSSATPGQVLKADANGLPVDATNTDAQVSATVTASHARSHAITSNTDHTSAATAGQILKADANGLPVNATNTDAQVSSTVTASHARSHAITSSSDHTSAATAGQILKADANGLPVNATNTDAQVSSTVSASHTRSHAITSATDHTSAATAGQVLKADANGLPVNATNTDAQVSSTVSASHTRAHAMDSASDHSAATQGNVPYAGAAGAWALLAPGTSGQMLTSKGAAANPSWGDGQSQSINFNQGATTVGNSITTYMQNNGVDTTIARSEMPVSINTSPLLKMFVVNVTTNTKAGNTVFTVMKNGVATAMVLTYGASATGVQSATGSIVCVLGDKITVRIVTAGGGGTLTNCCASVLITN